MVVVRSVVDVNCKIESKVTIASLTAVKEKRAHMTGSLLIGSKASMWISFINLPFWLTRILWKLMGARLGKGSNFDPDALIFEADLVEIVDKCRIVEEAALLYHKFSNGGLKLALIIIPSKTLIGSRAVVPPGSRIVDEGICIMPLTRVLPS